MAVFLAFTIRTMRSNPAPASVEGEADWFPVGKLALSKRYGSNSARALQIRNNESEIF